MKLVRGAGAVVTGWLVGSLAGGVLIGFGLPPLLGGLVFAIVGILVVRWVWQKTRSSNELIQVKNQEDLTRYKLFLERQEMAVEHQMARAMLEHESRMRLLQRKRDLEHEVRLVESLPNEFLPLDMQTAERQRLREPVEID